MCNWAMLIPARSARWLDAHLSIVMAARKSSMMGEYWSRTSSPTGVGRGVVAIVRIR